MPHLHFQKSVLLEAILAAGLAFVSVSNAQSFSNDPSVPEVSKPKTEEQIRPLTEVVSSNEAVEVVPEPLVAAPGAESEGGTPIFANPPQYRFEPIARNREPQPRLYGNAEALFLNLSNTKEQPVVLNSVTGQTLLTTNATNPGFAPGARFNLGYVFNETSAVEGTYFGLNRWNSSATVIGSNDLQIPGDVALSTHDFFDSNRIQTTYKSSLHNAELNYVHSLPTSGISVIAGFRYLHLNELYNINSFDTDTEKSDYRIKTQNDLFGGQLGLRMNRRWGPWGADVTGKAGVFGNVTQQQTYMGDFNNSFVFRDSTTNGATTSFVGDINPNVSYRFNSTWGVRAGYNLIWITDVSRAPNQLDFTDTPKSGMDLSPHSSAFLHGVNVGLEANW